MTRTHQPELTRAALLEAVEKVLRTEGPNFSLGAVARTAGVSKGGLFHHFPTKERLLVAVVKALTEELHQELEGAHAREIAVNGEAPGSWLRAYIEMSFTPDDAFETFGTVLAPLVTHPEVSRSVQDSYALILKRAESDGLPLGRAYAVLLACDGLWFSPSTRLADLDNDTRTDLKEELLSWTRT